VLVHPVWCRPCMLRECPIDHRCMRGVRVAAVLDAARRTL
jgi:heptosyltransferase II